MRGQIVALIVVLAGLAAGAATAAADDPAVALRFAIERTAQARSARISLNQTTTAPTFVFSTTANGTLVDADHDLVLNADGTTTHRITKGTAVYEQRPADGAAPWTQTTRQQPATTTPFGTIALPDGTSLGDPKLFKSVIDKGAQAMRYGAATTLTDPAAQTRMLVADVDMLTVATAMQLGPSERARMAQMTGTLTLWAGSDGRITRNVLTLVIPGADGPTTLETTVDLSDLDAPLVITAP